MKILLSAYACEPYRGSEPWVGWNWALELARQNHDVWVITRKRNQEAIEKGLLELSPLPNLHFVYYDVPQWLGWWKKGERGIHLYYFLWQIGILGVAQKLHQAEKFDLVHHVTFVSIRQPSFMGFLGIPFIFGPVAGGERAPYALRKSFPLKGWIRDFLRDIQSMVVRFDPLMHLTFSTAWKIYATSEDTAQLIPPWYRHKASVHLAIGIYASSHENSPAVKAESDEKPFRILFAGRLVYLKGIHFALQAFNIFQKQFPNSHFTIVGDGPDTSWLKAIAEKGEAGKKLEWIPWVEHSTLTQMYSNYDVLMFPSLHDTGGAVILEGFAQGLPAICLDLGGPGIMVNDTCGYCIVTKGLEESAVIQGLSDALYDLAQNREQYKQLSRGALERAKVFHWENIVSRLYQDIGRELANGKMAVK